MVMPSITTNGSPSMIMRSANVPLSPSSALQTMYFRAGLAWATVFRFMAVGKPAAAAAAKPRGGDVGRDPIAGRRRPTLQAFVAVMGAIILDRTRIDHA